jgi:flagellar protein FlaJ
MIEISAGVPMHKAFENIHLNYEVVGVYFGEIVSKIYLGTSIDDAVNEVLMFSPSPNLRRILWQLLNSIKTGSDLGPSLEVVINQIVKEQQVAVQEYGRKLNPLAMFYMMVAIIVPSLGTVMLVVLSSFLGLNISLVILLAIAGFVGFVQFMFLSVIKSTRPPISAQ